MPIVVKKYFDFSFDPDACGDCYGYCCRGKSGKVWINEHDVWKISDFLGTNGIDFLGQFVDRSNNRLSLKERVEDGSYRCVFFDESIQACSIYEVRPEQCRSFPFWEYYKKHGDEVRKECPGVGGMLKGSG